MYKKIQNILNKTKKENPKIATVINYCTNDYQFIQYCVNSVKTFSSEIAIVAADHFFDGSKENEGFIQKTKEATKGVNFIYYSWIDNGSHPRFWCNYSRWLGLCSIKDDVDFVFFLDADEVVGPNFYDQIKSQTQFKFDACSFRTYWYFRNPQYRARRWETQPILARKSKLTKKSVFGDGERWSIIDAIPKSKRVKNFVDLDGKPMIHHYSWVRTKEQMLRKVESWSHKFDRDWVSLVNEEFSRDFNGTDFVHHYEYDILTEEESLLKEFKFI
ncbi:hypothetical protein MNBD_UNCLBAC01-812 [hydrothermal vent metagenome]|uniref:Glycosyltransferase n=1 Tax=hydrothermal vent metagenome TaxID=652676 RepID=A0A3B1DXW8_9ZZZZ